MNIKDRARTPSVRARRRPRTRRRVRGGWRCADGPIVFVHAGARYINSAPSITANWNLENENRWLVPLGAGVGRVFAIGRLPINAGMQFYYNVVSPNTLGPQWQLRTQVQFLFPK